MMIKIIDDNQKETADTDEKVSEDDLDAGGDKDTDDVTPTQKEAADKCHRSKK